MPIDGEVSSDIPYDADAGTLKDAVEVLSTLNKVDISRSKVNDNGGYTWTISFLDDDSHRHRGDMSDFIVHSSLTDESGQVPSVTVKELRKGTLKEVQRISINAAGAYVDPSSSFILKFMNETTNSILALPLDGTSCSGSKVARQIITTSTDDTILEGGDNAVSPKTNFTLTYNGYTTRQIVANSGTCSEKAYTIEQELEMLPNLYDVTVSGNDSENGDEGCAWIVEFNSEMGNPELLTGKSSSFDFYYKTDQNVNFITGQLRHMISILLQAHRHQ